MVRAIDDLFPVVRPEWTTIVTEFISQTPHVLTVGIHRVDIEVAIAHRSEDELLAVERDRRFGIVSRRVRQLLRLRAIGIGGKDVVRRIDGPNVSARKVRPRWALFIAEMSRRIEDALVAGIKVRASGAALAVRDHFRVRAVDIHRVDLIALMTRARRLEDELLAVGREIRFGVLATEGLLLDISQVLLIR